tara:strand:- start:923 stop:1150 length:228 start_codon:yes stop_codon:yes gene_type:complete
MSRNIPLPYIAVPPQDYDQRYFAELAMSVALFMQQQVNPGEGRFTNLVLTELPTSATGLEPGTLYNDSGTIKVVV